MKNGDYAVIGKSVPRIDAHAKVTGQALYTGDLKFPNMLFGKILTSPYAHARILRIDTSDAERLPGVKAVITHKDVPSKKYGVSPARRDENIFCIDKVRHVGDKVAAVAAIDEEIVYQALKLIRVDYEVLPAVFDPVEAMAEGAPLIHEDYPGNINAEVHQSFGDVEEAFNHAFHVRKDTFVGHRTYHSPLEPHVSIAMWEGEKVTLYATTQKPHYLQVDLARQFDLTMGNVRVVAPFIGGGFGAKAAAMGLDFAAVALSRITGRPVKMFYDRHDMFAHNRGRHRQIMELTTGVDREGKILGVHANFIMDGGAYTGNGIATAYYSGALLPVSYEFDNFRYDMFRVYTNLPGSASQRGHGAPHPKYALESQLDRIARDLDMDPLELRLKNRRKPDTITVNELAVNSCELEACIETARKVSGWNEKKGKLPRGGGIGIALGGYVCGAAYPIYRTNLPHSTALIKVNEDGSAATLYTGAVDIGQGSNTVLCQMAAEAMGFTYENMSVVSADTERSTHDFGAYSSRQTLMSGWAVKRAGEMIKAKVLEMAGEMMQVDPATLDCRDAMIFAKDNPSIRESFGKVTREYFVLNGPLTGHGSYTPPKLGGSYKGAAVGASPAYSFSAQVIEVQVDEETGEIDLKGAWDIHDSGRVINPALVHGQTHGGIFMGVGEAIWEEVRFDEKGRILNPNLSEYRMPTALDVPMFESVVVESSEPAGPWGVKEVGEGAGVPTEGSVANAIFDATGVFIDSLPLTYEKVWRALKSKREGGN
ncbi:MAG: 4-hydroxybenzoyl-CoA reductase subunit alpha [Syntrophorhabdaceae bacterium]|nr:4-hydroxybenzoyl-CoA reductase subunit alpha [Syntrophorhabdaceae bacterium]MDD5242785.1 4-hydroxybenzoyl-CoA reductase subunit alpha [Syntrophorhabdaceae bacterium]